MVLYSGVSNVRFSQGRQQVSGRAARLGAADTITGRAGQSAIFDLPTSVTLSREAHTA